MQSIFYVPPALGIMRRRLHVMTSVFRVFVSFSCFQEGNTFAGSVLVSSTNFEESFLFYTACKISQDL